MNKFCVAPKARLSGCCYQTATPDHGRAETRCHSSEAGKCSPAPARIPVPTAGLGNRERSHDEGTPLARHFLLFRYRFGSEPAGSCTDNAASVAANPHGIVGRPGTRSLLLLLCGGQASEHNASCHRGPNKPTDPEIQPGDGAGRSARPISASICSLRKSSTNLTCDRQCYSSTIGGPAFPTVS